MSLIRAAVRFLLLGAAVSALAVARQYVISTYAGGAPPPTPVVGVNMPIGPDRLLLMRHLGKEAET